MQSLYRSPGARGIGNIGNDDVREDHPMRMVFIAQNFVPGPHEPSLEELPKEQVGFDDQHAALRVHREPSTHGASPIRSIADALAFKTRAHTAICRSAPIHVTADTKTGAHDK